MTHRFFAAVNDFAYDQARLRLDELFGHPSDAAQTCIEPAATAPHDTAGRPVLAVNADFCEWPQVSQLLPELLAAGVVEEITEQAYRDATSASPMV